MTGYWIGKYFFKKDITKEGSGNVGTTNVFRTIGPIAGVIVLIIDIAKGSIATILPGMMGFHSVSPLIFGIFAVIGHCYSIFLNFRGGKAVATTAGVMLAYDPTFFLFCAAVFVIVLFFGSMISLASIITFISGTIEAFLMPDDFLKIVAIIVTLISLYGHRENIKRILKGQERTVPFGILYWKSKKAD